MITFANRGNLVQYAHDLPVLPKVIQTLYMDFETSSGNPKEKSVNPWHHCTPCGYAITWDGLPEAYYVPMTLPFAKTYLIDAMYRTNTYCNHNAKYDMHVFANNVAEFPQAVNVRCTLVGSRLLDTNLAYSGGYGLDNVAAKWLHEDIHPFEQALKPYLVHNQDYGAIPNDVMAEYACQDVLTCRRLDKYITSQMPEQCSGVYSTEQELTSVLFDVEQRGLCVDPKQLAQVDFAVTTKLLDLEAQIENIVGRKIKPNANADCFAVLCEMYGLPVIGWTDKGEPSFNKYALKAYLGNPYAPHHLIKLMMQYREFFTLLNFFVTPYQELHIKGVLHSWYNQLVRTGRMSCKWPNSQQLNKAAKTLIHPRPGHSFISIDYSNIEFRLMMLYIEDQPSLDAFAANPDTDFHQLTADMCGVSRRAAKTLNFAIGFGAGKRKTVKMLASNADIVADIDKELVDVSPDDPSRKGLFDKMCVDRGEQTFNTYHQTFPTMKRVARRAAFKAQERGHVFNLYGRHRHLPFDKAHIAFNTLCQSSAADLLKERTVACVKILPNDVHLVASVHDESLFECPTEMLHDDKLVNSLVECLETPGIPIGVPIRVSVGTSEKTWADAGKVTRQIHWQKSGSDQTT